MVTRIVFVSVRAFLFLRPRQLVHLLWPKNFCQQFWIRAAGCIPFAGGYQDHRRAHRHPVREGVQNQQDLIHGAQPVRTNDKGRRTQRRDEVTRIEPLTQWAEQAARALDHRDIKSLCDATNVRDDFPQPHALSFLARGEQRGQRCAKMPWVHFVERQDVSRGGAQRAGVTAVAGTNGFKRDNAQILCP